MTMERQLAGQRVTDQEDPETGVPSGRASRARTGLGESRRFAVPVALVALIIVFSIVKTDTFFTVANLQTVLTTQAPLLLLSTGLTFSLAAGEFDLSIGGLIDFVVILVPWLAINTHLNIAVVFLIVAALAVVVGLANATWVVFRKVNSFILTLAIGTVLTGIALGMSGSETLDSVPGPIMSLFGGEELGIGNGFWIALVIGLVTAYFMAYRVAGRHFHFTGQSEEVARLCGVPVRRVKVTGFILTSLVAAVAGLVILGQSGAGSANLGDAYTLNAFAGVFLGMTVARVPRVNVIGTWAAVLLVAVGSTGLQLFGLQGWVTDVFSGGVLAVALWFSSVTGRQSRRAAASARKDQGVMA